MKAPEKQPAEQPTHKKWWRRYAEGDWRWADESWQTEQSKKKQTHEHETRNPRTERGNRGV